MKVLKKVLIIFVLVGCIFMKSNKVQAAIEEVSVSSYEDIPALETQNYVWEQVTKMSETDNRLLQVFTGSNEGWIPRIKFEGDDPNNIKTYIFCLSYHDLAPTPSIKYKLAYWDTLEKMNEVRYIMENGFGTQSYADNYDKLIEDYYITQLAIWQLQGDSGYEIENSKIDILNNSKYDQYKDDEESEPGKAYHKIKDLVEGAKDHSNRNQLNNKRMIAKFVPTGNYYGYQILTPFKIYNLPEEPETYTCEKVGDWYYDAHGNAVNQSDYEKSCNPVCEYKDGKYYDSNHKEVSEAEYKKSCNPICKYENGKYYDNQGNVVSKSTYENICEKIEPKISISYIDNCTDNFAQNAKMKLVSGNSCSGKTIKSWTSGKLVTFDNITAGTYTICDTTNDYDKTITVKNVKTLQEFEMMTNDTCEEPYKNEPNSNTGLTSYLVLGGVLGFGTILYLVLRKKGIFVKIK